MKKFQILFSTVVCGFVLTFTAAASAQVTKQGIATVVRVRGEASYTVDKLDGGVAPKWIPLVPGKILTAGATIKTEPDAMVDVILGKQIDFPQAATVPNEIALAPDSPVRGMVDFKPETEQNVVRLSGSTILRIDTLTVSDTGVDTVSDTELDLKAGRIFASVKKLTPQSTYFVKSPTGIAAVRGTLFGFGADNWCAVVKSSVLLSYTGPDGLPHTVLVGAGDQFNPSGGGGGISPVPANLLAILQDIATAVDTAYGHVDSFAFDSTECFVSPGTGSRGNGHHHGGGGGGGGDE
jgi:FecR protein